MRFLPGILLVVLHIYCWIEIAQSDPKQVRQLSRGIWALIVFIPLAGPIGWLMYGRPNGDDGQADRPTPQAARRRARRRPRLPAQHPPQAQAEASRGHRPPR